MAEVIDRRLGESAFLGGSEYSVADIATFPWMRAMPFILGADVAAKLPNVASWVKTIDERPAVKKALAAVDAVRAQTTPFDKADPVDLDKVFGRGQFAAA